MSANCKEVRAMKKTAVRLELVPSKEYPGCYDAIPHEKITCHVAGEMDTGTKVWLEDKTGEQYFLTRIHGVYAFYKE